MLINDVSFLLQTHQMFYLTLFKSLSLFVFDVHMIGLLYIRHSKLQSVNLRCVDKNRMH